MRYVPGDLSSDEIERRYRMALLDIRQGGTGDIARRDAPIQRTRTAAVLRALTRGHMTVGEIATVLRTHSYVVWGHMSFLRKQRKVEVKGWRISPHKRRVAVYGLAE